MNKVKNSPLKSTPGPGTYSPTIEENSPRISFPKASKRYKKNDLPTPGPADYQSNSSYFNGPKFTIPKKKPKLYYSPSPGPGSYNPSNEVSYDRFPSVRIGRAKRDLLPKKNSESLPGPASYSVDLSSISGPKWKFSTTLRKSTDRSESPGPGQYKTPSVSSGISYTISLSKKFVKRDLTPGPGAYSPRRKQTSPSAILGSSMRESRNKLATPGPGSYDVDAERCKQSSIFGSSKREEYKTFASPGPGNYFLPGLVGRGPRYSIRQKLPKLRQLVTPGPGDYENARVKVLDDGPKWTIPSTGRDTEPAISPTS